eukprot:scaffold288830_cov30-Tisochrysis_lutea.AAC.2
MVHWLLHKGDHNTSHRRVRSVCFAAPATQTRRHPGGRSDSRPELAWRMIAGEASHRRPRQCWLHPPGRCFSCALPVSCSHLWGQPLAVS